jgi:hypothetical protein
MGLTREFITEVTDCPVCGQPKGTSCSEKDGTFRQRNHFERMHKAQMENLDVANSWKTDYMPSWKVVKEHSSCPECSAEKGEPCIGVEGIHRARREMFLVLKTIKHMGQ